MVELSKEAPLTYLVLTYIAKVKEWDLDIIVTTDLY